MRVTVRVTRRSHAAVVLAACLMCPALAAVADEAAIVATVDKAKLVKIPENTETLVIGNPTIADVTLLKKNNLMILTPRSYGETNFIALDSKGNPVAESTIQVVNETSAVIVQRGMSRESYSCAPRCQPTERLGDDKDYIKNVADTVQAHTSRLATSAAPVNSSLAAR